MQQTEEKLERRSKRNHDHGYHTCNFQGRVSAGQCRKTKVSTGCCMPTGAKAYRQMHAGQHDKKDTSTGPVEDNHAAERSAGRARAALQWMLLIVTVVIAKDQIACAVSFGSSHGWGPEPQLLL